MTPQELANTQIFYRTFDTTSTETIRMGAKPGRVLAGTLPLSQRKDLLAEEGLGVGTIGHGWVAAPAPRQSLPHTH